MVPDLPGCFPVEDALEDAMENAREAIDLHVETVLQDGGELPLAQPIDVHQGAPGFAGWIWAVVDVPVEKYLGPAEKINITVPRLVLNRIDEYARSHRQSRSGFLVEAARAAMRA